MPFISYAQNLEDVMLWRALQHVGRGTYVDVGANDPDQCSVTRAFYESGWRGINIEPVREWHERLCEQRREDINLMIAVADKEGELPFYEVPQSGLSTLDETVAEECRRGGLDVLIRPVTSLTLRSVCERYGMIAPHFLKVDVEGAEARVLAGLDLSRCRPWVVLVEATRPNSQQQVHEAWEGMLTQAGYTAAYFDGLNRFYVAAEHREILAAFGSPPNYFDRYVTARQHDAETRLAQVYGSLSWRLTKPLRAWSRLKRLFRG